jgi:hypothetical protein
MTNTIIKSTLLAVIVLAAASYATASVNLDGEYWFGSMSADTSTKVPWCERGTVVVIGDNWSQEWDDQDGHHIFSSTFTTSTQPDGSIDIELSSGTYNIAWNGDVMIHADTAPDADNRLGIDIMFRKATNPLSNNIVGDYSFFGHHLNSLDGSDSDGWGNAAFKANGTASIKQVNDKGHAESGTLNWTLNDINPMLNIQGQTSENGLLLGKGGVDLAFQVLPEEGRDGDLGYNVFIKKTTQTITRAEIAGIYQVRFLESGPDGSPYTCGQGTVTIQANGSFSIDAYYSDGEQDTGNGTYTVGPGSKIKFNGTTEGIISPDKKLIFAPEYTYKHHPRESTDWLGGLFFVRIPNGTTVLQFGNISGSKSTNLTINDAAGNSVMFTLTGGGYGEITGESDFNQVILYNTTEKSLLTILTKGTTETSVGNVIVNGPLKGISAKNVNLRGNLTVGGSLGSLTLNDVADYQTIKIGLPLIANPKAAVTIVFDQGDFFDINSDMPIKSITAFDWGGTLTAPSVGSITTKSDYKLDKWGYLDIDANVTGTIGTVKVVDGIGGSWNCKSVKSITTYSTDDFYLTLSQEPNTKIPALGTLTVKEDFGWSWIVSAGNIGTVTVGSMTKSSCFAGVDPAYLVDMDADYVIDLPPVLGDTFNQTATIKSIAIKGIKGEDPNFFTNSNIAAANISSINIAYPEYGNDGIPFGISMWNDPKTLTIKDAGGTHSWTSLHIGDAIVWLTDKDYDMEIRRD